MQRFVSIVSHYNIVCLTSNRDAILESRRLELQFTDRLECAVVFELLYQHLDQHFLNNKLYREICVG